MSPGPVALTPPGTATRRTLVASLLMGPLTLALLRCAPPAGARASVGEILAELVDRIPLPDPLAVGRAYLAQLRTAASLSTSSDSAFEQLAIEVFDSLPSDDSLRRLGDAFSAALMRDFAEGRIVPASGWILSKSEASFCALLALEAESVA